MLSLPLIFREFQVASRRKRTFVLRCVVGGFLMCMALIFIVGTRLSGGSQALGRQLLTTFAWQLFILIFAFVPALTCGCIAEEKKQGTLGLLFLTRLNSADIVLGKFFGKAFDVCLLVLTAVPFVFVPVLLGGVAWEQIFNVILCVVALVVLTLATGVFCSTVSRSTAAAIIVAYLGLAIYNIAVMVLPHLHQVRKLAPLKGYLELIPTWVAMGSPFYTLVRGSAFDSLTGLGICAAVAVVVLSWSVWRLPAQVHKQNFREPLWRSWFGRPNRPVSAIRRNARLLDRNPILWLYFGRIRGSYLLQLILALGLFAWATYGVTRADNPNDVYGLMCFGSLLGLFCLKIFIVVHIARTFATEKEDGALEIILCAPFSNRQIINGKLLSVAGHYGVVWGVMLVFLAISGLGLMDARLEFEEFMISLYIFGTTITGMLWAVSLSSLIAFWSKSVKQSITVSVLVVLLLIWFLTYALYFGAMILLSVLGFSSWLDESTIEPLAFVGVLGRLAIDLLIASVAYRMLCKKLRNYAAR